MSKYKQRPWCLCPSVDHRAQPSGAPSWYRDDQSFRWNRGLTAPCGLLVDRRADGIWCSAKWPLRLLSRLSLVSPSGFFQGLPSLSLLASCCPPSVYPHVQHRLGAGWGLEEVPECTPSEDQQQDRLKWQPGAESWRTPSCYIFCESQLPV